MLTAASVPWGLEVETLLVDGRWPKPTWPQCRDADDVDVPVSPFVA